MAIEKLIPTREESNVVKVPTFFEGRIKDELMQDYQDKFGKNSNFSFTYGNKGSNPFIVGGLNYLLRTSNFRMFVPTDDVYGELFPMIKNSFYSDLNAFDVRERKPSYEKNNGIWKQLINLAEEKEGNVKFPFRAQGFYCIPDESEEGYEVKILSAENFRVISDERLNFLQEIFLL